MRINKFSFKDNNQNWELAETSFGKLTLLVGASGVGKTRILRALDTVVRIASGNTSGGVEWSVSFTIGNNSYTWSGETTGESFLLRLNGQEEANGTIKREQLVLNGTVILERTLTETLFNGDRTVKFSLTESVVSILKEEELIKPINDNFSQVRFNDYSPGGKGLLGFLYHDYNEIKSIKSISIEKLRGENIDIIRKLYLASLYCEDIFDSIKERYIEIFPLVEDMRFISEEVNLGGKRYLYLDLQIKERGIDDWIQRMKMSSGMYRSLIHIAEIYLCAEDSVFLIDEFENSLGINCIDELVDEILSTDRDLQFIITSHHPYIINNIDLSCWKLVTRRGGVVKTTPVLNYIQGESSHDKFMQLIQLSQYQTGVE